MQRVFRACILLALVVCTIAAQAPHRRLLTLNAQQNMQQPPRPYRGYRRPNTGDVQLAANNAAIVNTQLAIDAAVNSGADPYVTESAARYGNYQAYQATQATRRCGTWWRC